MKNKDKPAMPFQEVRGITGGMITKFENHNGLTKREDFAKSAMQGLLSSMNLAEIHSASTSDVCAIVNLSIEMADELLEALDKPVK